MGTIDLLFGESAFQLAEHFQKIQPELSESRAKLLSQAVMALSPVEGDPIELEAWIHSATDLLSKCEDRQVITVIEIVQEHLRSINKFKQNGEETKC